VERSCAAWNPDLGIATFADDICQSAGLCQRQILPSTTSFVAQIGSPLTQDYCGSLGIAVIPARCRDKIEGKKQEKTL
jgi:hypothetical protein